MARNLLLKGATRRRSHRVLVERLAGELHAAGPLQLPEDTNSRDRLRAALAGLPQVDREILTLSAWEGLTPSEIAGVVGRSANSVRVRLHRAKARLRGELNCQDLSQHPVVP